MTASRHTDCSADDLVRWFRTGGDGARRSSKAERATAARPTTLLAVGACKWHPFGTIAEVDFWDNASLHPVSSSTP
jgi:hypothetical protein